MRVLVCHSGRQHSHQLAMALAGREMLAKYVTGLPAHRQGWLGRRLFRNKGDAYSVPIDPKLVKHVYIEPVARRITRGLGPSFSRAAGSLGDALFDRWICRLVDKLRPDVVVAYETGALCIFRRAKKLGVKAVLDAASLHHRWQDRFQERQQPHAAQQRIVRRKDAEIALADEILAVSEFARESYIDAGVPPERVHTMPLGVDCENFRRAPQHRGGDDAAERPLRFVYVGNQSPLKGIRVLRDAVQRLKADGERFAVSWIGNSDGPPGNGSGDGIVRLGWMSHDRLSAELPQHDVLVLPSFLDSFGLVVAEAMACGLPAIVTHNVGAKEMITPGVNGLIIPPGDATALADAMRWFLSRRKDLSQMGQTAQASAERYDWAHYRRRVTDFFASM
jgi:glycosyltransferase involved in cell wall biosynthesis